MSLSSYSPFLVYGDFSDVYLEESKSLSLVWRDGRVESLSSAEDSGMGLRLIKDLETRFGFTDLSNPFGQRTSAETEKCRRILDQLKIGLAEKQPPSFVEPALKSHPIQKKPDQISIDQKIALLKKANDVARTSPLVRQVNVNYGEKIKKVGYVNSKGDTFIEERVYTVFAVMVTAEREGDLQNAYESMGGVMGFELFDHDRVSQLAQTVAARALAKLDAPQAPVGEMPVVIHSSAGGTLIHEAVGHALEADAVLEGTSPAYLGKLGKVVANEKLTVFDNPTVSSKRGSFHFDDEGVPSEPSKLIDKGVLKDYMFDRLSAKRANRQPNGHGRRESYAHRPIPRMSNTYIAPGSDDPNSIVASLKNGLLVTRMGGGQVNTANGDFVFEVEEGFQVENGKKKMIRGATLLGNGPQVLKDIDHVGSDHGWGIGTCGKEGQGVPVSDAIPTLHIKKLIIGGQQN